ncbi:MAG: glutamyl-tRNA reductase [Thermoanaerobaculia bacterium]
MPLVLIGVNHKTAPVEVREQLSVADGDQEKLLASIHGVEGVEGVIVLSTCNRIEVILSVRDEDVLDPVIDHLISRSTLSRAEIEQHFYILRHRDVVRHLFRVASGLDSMILGEPQIAGQFRAAYQRSVDAQLLDMVLRKLGEHTLHVAKKVRTDTGIGESAVSIPFAGVELARKIFGDLTGLRVLLVGAGEIGELTAIHLHGFGAERVWVANRSFEKAVELAGRFDGEAIEFGALDSKLGDSDIVIVSTSAPNYVITSDQVREALSSRRRRSLFLIDLSVPRNIDPTISEVSGSYLYNVDDLKEVVDTNLESRAKKAEFAEEIVEKESDGFVRRIATHEVVPTIVELQHHLDEMRRAELEKCLRKLGPITTEQQAAIEMLTTGIVNKVLHYPILRLKESASDEPAAATQPESVRETIRRIFGLR